MRDVGQRVVELLVRQRPAAPVREARRLVDVRAGGAADQLVVGNRIAEAADHGGDLRVEDRMRDQVAEMEDDLDVLPGGMEHLHRGAVRHQREERREVDALGERIDDHRQVRTGHLDQAEFGPEGRLADELGVDGDEIGAGKGGARLFEGGGCRQNVHDPGLSEYGRSCLALR